MYRSLKMVKKKIKCLDVVPKKKVNTIKKICMIFRHDLCINFLELCIHYLELQLVVLADLPVEINLYPCYYAQIFHKT